MRCPWAGNHSTAVGGVCQGVRVKRTAVAAVVACTVFGVAPASSVAGAGARARAATVPVVPCSAAAQRVTVTSSVRLDPSCIYSGGFDITASDVVLDCAGALVRAVPGTHAIGVLVATDADHDLSGVTIRRCRIDGFFNNIHVQRRGGHRLPAGHEYDHHLFGVTIADSTLTGSRGVGLYVNNYVTGTQVTRTTIIGSGSTGIYLDEGSRRTTVRDSVIAGNGFVENGPGGTNTNFGGIDVRYWGPGREGIAIDGARNTVVRNNWIIGNAAGGVFLYTNCGENVHSDPGSWMEHRFGAEHTTIDSNVIAGGNAGVWVASRQGENVYPMDCSDVPYIAGPLQAIIRDRAAHTTITDNTIGLTDFGVRIEDDGTVVRANRFVGRSAADYAVVVGTPFRPAPVSDTTVSDNVSVIPGNPDPYRIVDPTRRLVATGNSALGVARSFCGAPEIPRGPFVMVSAFAPQDPHDPPVDPPDIEPISLGVLAPCD